jgi:hypothetical protein
MSRHAHFPPYELIEDRDVQGVEGKTRRLERLYHLTQSHAWDGKAVLGALVDRHGTPGRDLDPAVRESLARVLSILLWGELAAWNISADLAREIDELDAKMAATAQVFDEARHFYVMRDYVKLLGPVPPLGGIPRRLLRKVLDAPSLATKLVGMQLLFETNAVVIFRRLGESGVCPILSELLPYFERDESRHVGLGVMYIPRLVAKMTPSEARRTARFQLECILLLMAGGLTLRQDFARLGLDQRLMATRVTSMQHDIVEQMVEARGDRVLAAVLSPRSGFGPKILDFLHPPSGLQAAGEWHQRLHRGMTSAAHALDRILA